VNSLFLPFVANGASVTGEGTRDVEQRLFTLMRDDPRQGRKGMVRNDVLAKVAELRCWMQAKRRYTGHVDPEGYGANYYVRVNGYRLPDWYSQELDANNVESLAHAGDGNVDACWQGWLNSEPHRIHLLGLNDFYAAQTNVGIAMYHLEDSEYKFYWAVISAPPES